MSLKMDSRVTMEVYWSWTERETNVTTMTNGNLRRQFPFSSDTSPAVDTVWCAQDVALAASTTTSYDLTQLTRSIFDEPSSVELGNLCAIYVHNKSAAAPLAVMNTGTGTAETVLEGSVLQQTLLPPGGALCLCNPLANWSVTTVRKTLQIENLSADAVATFDLIVTGILAVPEEI